MGELRFVEFLADTALVREARALADGVIGEDPRLDGKWQAMRGWMEEETEDGLVG